MPLQSRKRRSQPAEDSDDPDPSPPQRRRLTQKQFQPQRRNGESSTQGARANRRLETPEDDEEDDALSGDEELGDSHGGTNKDRLVKKLIRLALASEYIRQPLKRTDISSKVLGTQGRMFKSIFDQAQRELREVFGMQLVELPMREKTKLSQRRAAQNSDRAPTSSKQYLLQTVLPQPFRESEIVQPHGFREQTYTGLVTMIVSLIYLNGKVLPENKLIRYLTRMNADDYTPIDKTEKIIALMVKQGYITKQKDDTGDGGHDYYLGPRAKMEIGSDGVLNMLKTVYGVKAPEDLEKKLQRNIGPDLDAIAADEGPSQKRVKGGVAVGYKAE
ncbi:uncharacterized protein LAJ45_06858 [Morchella importuna]|uniref:uncharacterized protein n=1 Tax=Morchella importuna TaxID=1174673 RepID=UPI001E8DD31B|nr:uncharacterized protein LAJ45_06858 [Morchella importuna]KAH8149318.1 hypothetical protein LAJ45_06858 [Morchella importuna]